MQDSALLLLHAAATAVMTGLIWFVQVVHYPLMRLVGESEFAKYAQLHQRRTGWIVGPVMIVEMVTAIVIAGSSLRLTGSSYLGWIGLVLLIVIWFSTALIQVPRHRRLLRGFDAQAHRSLVNWNWLRTVAWSIRLVFSLVILGRL